MTMAILNGTFDGAVVPIHPILVKAGVDTFLAVTNNGPNEIRVITALGTFPLATGNSEAFFLPSGTVADIDGPLSTATWELVVPG
jgi:hypothetical protein